MVEPLEPRKMGTADLANLNMPRANLATGNVAVTFEGAGSQSPSYVAPDADVITVESVDK